MADYLLAEVLDRQSEEVRLLLQEAAARDALGDQAAAGRAWSGR